MGHFSCQVVFMYPIRLIMQSGHLVEQEMHDMTHRNCNNSIIAIFMGISSAAKPNDHDINVVLKQAFSYCISTYSYTHTARPQLTLLLGPEKNPCTQFCQDQIRDNQGEIPKAVRKNLTVSKSSITNGPIIFGEFDLRREQESSQMTCVIQKFAILLSRFDLNY